MFFIMLVRKSGEENWSRVPMLFAIERGNDADHYITLMFEWSTKAKREFRFIPVVDPVSEIRNQVIAVMPTSITLATLKRLGWPMAR